MIPLFYPKFWQSKNILSYLLLPIGWLYLTIGFLRKKFAKPVKWSAYTICVGNATIGGTGKTQLVIKLAKIFTSLNMNFIILSKGYGGRNSHYSLVTNTSNPADVGDEALELCKYGITFSVPSLQYAPEIIGKYKPDIVLMDDGMQNPNVIKDYIIMTIDGERYFGNMMPIPAGPMRQDISSIQANAVVIMGDERQYQRLSQDNCLKQILRQNDAILLNAKTIALNKLHPAKYYAFAGIGNNDKFFNMLQSCYKEIQIIKYARFPDHYHYTIQDINNLITDAKSLNARLVTTQKDYVKIKYLIEEANIAISFTEAEMQNLFTIPRETNKSDVDSLQIAFIEIDLSINLEQITSRILDNVNHILKNHS